MCSTRDVFVDFEDGTPPRLIGEADTLTLAVMVATRCGFVVSRRPGSIRETPVDFLLAISRGRKAEEDNAIPARRINNGRGD